MSLISLILSAWDKNVLQKAQDTLTASQYGWVLDYYPQSNQVYGGVAYTIKFTHDDAIVRYEKNPDDGE